MKIFYWSPFLSNIATINAVLNSVNSLLKYDKNKKYDPHIIDAVGEWENKISSLNDIKVKKLYSKNNYLSLPRGGFLKSRFSQLIIFFVSFVRLKKLISKEEPDYLVAHLIISLPLLLFRIFKFKTKLIIRISGTPKLNFFRKFFWKICSKTVFKVTCPTTSSFETLKKLNIFDNNKLEILYDPIIIVKEIKNKKNVKLDENLKNNEFVISIGRLTTQKNFQLLIKAFSKINKKFPNLKLVIIGEGEERKNLEKLISNFNLNHKIYLLGHKPNVFNYLNKAKCFISSSLYEDPGFVLLEAGYLNKSVFAANSGTGPSEILDKEERGFLYKNNDYENLIQKFFTYMNLDELEIKKKKIKLKKFSKNFTIFSHYKTLKKILS